MTTPAPSNPGPISAVNIRLKFPEFADPTNPTDASIELALEEALFFMSSWNGKGSSLAQMYLAAHIMAIAAYAGETGGRDVSAESIGRISIRYKSVGKDTFLGDVQTTVYGRRYQQIQGSNIQMFQVLAQRQRYRGGCW